MNRFSILTIVFAVGLLLGALANRSWTEANTPVHASEKPARTIRAASSPSRNTSGEPPATPADNHAAIRQQTFVSDTEARPLASKAMTSDATTRQPTQELNLVSIPRKFLPKIQCMVFNTASNCLYDDIVELLNIAPAEREQLDRLIAATRERVESHELDRAMVTEQSATRVVLKIAANADEGKELGDAFEAGVQASLGDRAASFLERAKPYEATLFNNFGMNDTLLTVTRDPNSNLLRVQSQQEYTTTGGGHGSVSSITMSGQMPDRWKKFFQAP